LRRIGTTLISIFTIWLSAFALVYNGFSWSHLLTVTSCVLNKIML
jgi:hypothetical protein